MPSYRVRVRSQLLTDGLSPFTARFVFDAVDHGTCVPGTRVHAVYCSSSSGVVFGLQQSLKRGPSYVHMYVVCSYFKEIISTWYEVPGTPGNFELKKNEIENHHHGVRITAVMYYWYFTSGASGRNKKRNAVRNAENYIYI